MSENKTSYSDFIRRFIYLALMTIMFSVTTVTPVAAQNNKDTAAATVVVNPGVDFWREVRQRDGPVKGSTQVGGVDAGVLINSAGEQWRQFRLNKIIPYSGYLLGATLVVLIAFRLIRGKLKIEAGRSGRKILRFTLNQRTVHWIVAILFILLGITGIVLLLGRTLLLPYIGSSGFAAIASVSKTIHDYAGPAFAVALLFMLISYIKDNFYKLRDVKWFLNGGGMLGRHASAGRYNAGEKSWFWLAMTGGAVIIVSGLVLAFPIIEQTREIMAQSQIIHAIAAIVVLAASFGHIYLGTVGMEGALETMVTGYCDANWASEHHDEWYEEVAASGDASSGAAASKTRTAVDSSAQPDMGAS